MMPSNELQKACDYFYPNLTVAEAQEETLLCLQGVFDMMPPEEREAIVKRVFEKVNFLPTSPHRVRLLTNIFAVLRSSWLRPKDLLTRTSPQHHDSPPTALPHGLRSPLAERPKLGYHPWV